MILVQERYLPPRLSAAASVKLTSAFEQAEAERLLAAAGEPKRLVRTSGGHNDGGFRQSAEGRAEVERFLGEVAGAPR